MLLEAGCSVRSGGGVKSGVPALGKSYMTCNFRLLVIAQKCGVIFETIVLYILILPFTAVHAAVSMQIID